MEDLIICCLLYKFVLPWQAAAVLCFTLLYIRVVVCSTWYQTQTPCSTTELIPGSRPL